MIAKCNLSTLAGKFNADTELAIVVTAERGYGKPSDDRGYPVARYMNFVSVDYVKRRA